MTADEARIALKELKGTGAFLMYHAELEPEAEGADGKKATDTKNDEKDIKSADTKSEDGEATDAAAAAAGGKKGKRKSGASPKGKKGKKSNKTDDAATASKGGAAAAKEADGTLYQTFLESRPCSMENRAIELVIQLCRESGGKFSLSLSVLTAADCVAPTDRPTDRAFCYDMLCCVVCWSVRCHIVHLSSAEALPLIRAAKKEGLPLTVETCYHYLYFQSEEMPSGQPRFKCCPPIREHANREQLWEALADGTIDLVVSDHSPCTENLKSRQSGDYMVNWGGISSVQFGLSILHTAAMVQRKAAGHDWPQLVRWLSEAPAQLLNLTNTKGKISAGFDADLVVFDPTAEWKVTKEQMLFKNKLSAYDVRHSSILDPRSSITHHTSHHTSHITLARRCFARLCT